MKRLFTVVVAAVMVAAMLLAGCTVAPVPTTPVTETEAPTSEPISEPISEPETTEPITTEPITTEPITTEPTSEPTVTDPTATDPTTAPSTAAKTTQKTTTTTAEATTADWRKNYTYRQIINDNDFQNGFMIKNQQDYHVEGTWRPTGSQKTASWEIAQWGTYYSYQDRSGFQSLWNTRRMDTPANVLTDGIETLVYDDKLRSLSMTIDTYDFYGGVGHTDNSFWPHLLIEQSITNRDLLNAMPEEERKYYSIAADKIILTLDVRMTNFSREVYDGINACQFLSYYYLTSRTGPGFVWFGVPLFDDRGYDQVRTSEFVMDNGSGNYMYGVPMVEVYDHTNVYGRYDFFDLEGAPRASKVWMNIELDIKPWMEEVYKRGGAIYPGTEDIRDMVITGLNLGYEIHGTYDVTFEIRNYSLTTYFKK